MRKITLVGLGNYGKEYKNTRHNIGSLFIEKLFKDLGGKEWKEGKNMLYFDEKIGNSSLRLVIPKSFMNTIGEEIADEIKNTDELVVVHDDIDLPIGVLKGTSKNTSGGHLGIESIIKKRPINFRYRVGVGRPTNGNVSSYVVGKIPFFDRFKFKKVYDMFTKEFYVYVRALKGWKKN